jgi:hypothetical protein
MITPSQCKSLWKQFKSETEFTITQAVSTQVCISYNRALISDTSYHGVTFSLTGENCIYISFRCLTLPFCLSPQQAHRRGNSKLPPPWAIVAIAILGFNEIMVLLRYLVALCSVVLYVQLNNCMTLMFLSSAGIPFMCSCYLWAT